MIVREIDDPTDLRGVLRVNSAAWEAAYEDLLPAAVIDSVTSEPTDDTAREWFDHLGKHREGFFVAESEETVVGYADVRWGDQETKAFVGPEEAGLKAIYVDPERWGEGVGTALLDHSLERLPDAVTALKLEMLAGNDVGERFYEARGFEKRESATVELSGDTYETDRYAIDL